jgi:hypothetical protein
MQAKYRSLFVLCAALTVVLALPATAAQPSDTTAVLAPAPVPVGAPVVPAASAPRSQQDCAAQISVNLFDTVAAPMTPVTQPVAQAEIPDPGTEEYCWTESRWVYAGYCCTKSWGQAAVLRLQTRTCCQYTGCGGWSNTGSTQCSGYPCP